MKDLINLHYAHHEYFNTDFVNTDFEVRISKIFILCVNRFIIDIKQYMVHLDYIINIIKFTMKVVYHIMNIANCIIDVVDDRDCPRLHRKCCGMHYEYSGLLWGCRGL